MRHKFASQIYLTKFAATCRAALPEKVIEKLATSEAITIRIEREPDGKMRATSGSWDGEKVLMRDQVLEVRYATSDGRLHIGRKFNRHDDLDPPIEAYDPYGPGVTGICCSNSSTRIVRAVRDEGNCCDRVWIDDHHDRIAVRILRPNKEPFGQDFDVGVSSFREILGRAIRLD